MHRIAVLIVIALGGCPAPRAPAPTAPLAPADVVTAVRATIDQWRQAYESRSIEALGKLYAHEPTLAIAQGGVVQLGWGAIEATLRTTLGHATAVRMQLKDIQVIALGPTAAFAVATLHRERSDATTTVSETGALTLILRKDDVRWVIVGEHYSYNRAS